jgi:hypothetical protein
MAKEPDQTPHQRHMAEQKKQLPPSTNDAQQDAGKKDAEGMKGDVATHDCPDK